MENYTEKLESLWEEMRLHIIKKVKELGKESGFTFAKTIPVSCCSEVILGNGGTLAEIGEDVIYDKDGYQFSYSELQYQELAELCNYLNNL
jgi:hypothetical protein